LSAFGKVVAEIKKEYVFWLTV